MPANCPCRASSVLLDDSLDGQIVVARTAWHRVFRGFYAVCYDCRVGGRCRELGDIHRVRIARRNLGFNPLSLLLLLRSCRPPCAFVQGSPPCLFFDNLCRFGLVQIYGEQKRDDDEWHKAVFGRHNAQRLLCPRQLRRRGVWDDAEQFANLLVRHALEHGQLEHRPVALRQRVYQAQQFLVVADYSRGVRREILAFLNLLDRHEQRPAAPAEMPDGQVPHYRSHPVL